MTERENTTLQVWDLLVRVSHWTIVVAFFVAYFTDDDLLTLHVWAGYVLGMVVLLRIVWGFVGPKHARFTDFFYRPSEVVGYLRDLLTFRGKRYVGHSPAGGAMVVILLVGLVAAVGSGLMLYAIEEDAGPLAGWVASDRANGPPIDHELPTDDDDDDGDDEHEGRERGGGTEGAGEFWEEAHDVLANLMLLLVILHVAGVLLASRVHHENLAKAMITGRKRAPAA